MAKIEGFSVKNFKSLKDVTLGRLWNRARNPTAHAHDGGHRQKRHGKKCPV